MEEENRSSNDIGALRDTSLRVLCLNVWGLHWLGAVRIRERLSHIVPELKHYDVVGLQEVWKAEDYQYLVDQLRDHLPHHTYLYSGIIGSGLCIFSRYPLLESHSHLFTVCGSMRNFLDGELFSGKGVLMCRVITPAGLVSVYNTHLDPRNRDSECLEIYSFIQQSRGDTPIILLGDFNTKTKNHAYHFLLATLDLVDVFADDPQDTCDLTSNIYTLGHMTPKRIDYVFFSNPRAGAELKMSVKSKCLAVTGLIPGKNFPYSDHEGVEVHFSLQRQEASGKSERTASWNLPKDKELAIQAFQQMECTLRSRRPVRLSVLMGLACYAALVMVVFFLCIFVNGWVHPVLTPYRMGWLTDMCMALTGAALMFFVVATMIRGQTKLALDSNLARINTILTHLQRTSS